MKQFRLDHGRTLRFVLVLVSILSSSALAQNRAPTPGEELLKKYANSDDTDALLREPKVRAQLEQLLGGELPHLERNLDVRGSVDVISGALSIEGNAPHQGTEEEGVVCITSYKLEVSAAIYSNGTVTAYARDGMYENLPRCITDWITQVNSGHRDRLTQPENVRMARKTGDRRDDFQ